MNWKRDPIMTCYCVVIVTLIILQQRLGPRNKLPANETNVSFTWRMLLVSLGRFLSELIPFSVNRKKNAYGRVSGTGKTIGTSFIQYNSVTILTNLKINHIANGRIFQNYHTLGIGSSKPDFQKCFMFLTTIVSKKETAINSWFFLPERIIKCNFYWHEMSSFLNHKFLRFCFLRFFVAVARYFKTAASIEEQLIQLPAEND